MLWDFLPTSPTFPSSRGVIAHEAKVCGPGEERTLGLESGDQGEVPTSLLIHHGVLGKSLGFSSLMLPSRAVLEHHELRVERLLFPGRGSRAGSALWPHGLCSRDVQPSGAGSAFVGGLSSPGSGSSVTTPALIKTMRNATQASFD